MNYTNTQYLLDKRPSGMPDDECWKLHQENITSLEKNSNEYIDSINLMIDSSKMISIGISISKKFDGSTLKQTDVKFLISSGRFTLSKTGVLGGVDGISENIFILIFSFNHKLS